MSNPTLSTLKAVEAELLEREMSLAAQQAELQRRLNALRSVMPMFQDIAVGAESLPAEPLPAEPLPAEPIESTDADEAESSAATAPNLEKAELNSVKAESNQAKAQKRKKAGRVKKDGRTADWQSYLREGAAEKPLQEAVLFFLQTQPEAPFSVADVMTALFRTVEMPRGQYLKARNRISNILSIGTRDQNWYRVKTGVYSLSNTAKAA
ncbi:hypothetical protein IQ241_08580 [Romeria aff. gracilis LEGE 07310]|uniref:Uncharacterized protein n=1 Tax=Vasconcelosia minhoensis LEGE 07310 TaxID=915328 RepID=A0A8J7A782_9CYAN|nr:hypothetical protein [Romeria gracilis]MBE9077350.1 hypothetical protein [Romeria aff. gracilis LEGE 07310]